MMFVLVASVVVVVPDVLVMVIVVISVDDAVNLAMQHVVADVAVAVVAVGVLNCCS